MLLQIAVLFASLVSPLALADDIQPILVDVGLTRSYVPIGFDDNDRIEFVTQGEFPNTCYKVGPYKVSVDPATKTISVQQKAYYYGGGMCIQLAFPFTQVVKVGLAKEGDYKLIDSFSNKEIGKLPITRATNPGPDDHLYAPITDAYVSQLETGEWDLFLSGQFSDRCTAFEEINVNLHDRVLVVQPVIKHLGEPACTQEKTRFLKKVRLAPAMKGAYLLHVRSLEGQAISKMVDLD
jgi:hypothetical protein